MKVPGANTYDQLRMRFDVWRRERKERAAEKRAAEPPGVTVPAWLVRATKFASWVATLSLVYFLWLYTLDIARDRAEALHITHLGQWVGDVQFWFPHIVGFAVVAFGIPYVAKIAIPTFVSLSWRQDPTPKAWSLFIAVAVSLVVISGTFAVQGHNIMERDRDAAVAVENVEREQLARQGNVAAIQHELDMLCVPDSARPTYQQQACRAGEVSWRARAATAASQNDYQADAIARSIPDAVRGDELRAELRRATQNAFVGGGTIAAVQREVVTERTGWIAQTLGWLEGIRAILLSFVMDIVALIMPLIALRLEQARNRQLGMAEGIPKHPWMIEDHSDEPDIIDMSPREAARAVFDRGGSHAEAEAAARGAAQVRVRESTLRDADTDETIVDRDGDLAVIVREHTRKKRGKDGKPIKIMMPAQPPEPDERGVDVDGGARQASVAEQPDDAIHGSKGHGNSEDESANQERQAAQKSDELDDQISQPEPSFTDDELEALRALEAAGATEDEQADVGASDAADDEADGVAEEEPFDDAQDNEPFDDAQDNGAAEQSPAVGDTDQINLPDETENADEEREPETRRERLLAAE